MLSAINRTDTAAGDNRKTGRGGRPCGTETQKNAEVVNSLGCCGRALKCLRLGKICGIHVEARPAGPDFVHPTFPS